MKYSFILILTHIKRSTKSFVFRYDCKSESRRGRFIYNRSKQPGTSFPVLKTNSYLILSNILKDFIFFFLKEKEDA